MPHAGSGFSSEQVPTWVGWAKRQRRIGPIVYGSILFLLSSGLVAIVIYGWIPYWPYLQRDPIPSRVIGILVLALPMLLVTVSACLVARFARIPRSVPIVADERALRVPFRRTFGGVGMTDIPLDQVLRVVVRTQLGQLIGDSPEIVGMEIVTSRGMEFAIPWRHPNEMRSLCEFLKRRLADKVEEIAPS